MPVYLRRGTVDLPSAGESSGLSSLLLLWLLESSVGSQHSLSHSANNSPIPRNLFRLASDTCKVALGHHGLKIMIFNEI